MNFHPSYFFDLSTKDKIDEEAKFKYYSKYMSVSNFIQKFLIVLFIIMYVSLFVPKYTVIIMIIILVLFVILLVTERYFLLSPMVMVGIAIENVIRYRIMSYLMFKNQYLNKNDRNRLNDEITNIYGFMQRIRKRRMFVDEVIIFKELFNNRRKLYRYMIFANYKIFYKSIIKIRGIANTLIEPSTPKFIEKYSDFIKYYNSKDTPDSIRQFDKFTEKLPWDNFKQQLPTIAVIIAGAVPLITQIIIPLIKLIYNV